MNVNKAAQGVLHELEAREKRPECEAASSQPIQFSDYSVIILENELFFVEY